MSCHSTPPWWDKYTLPCLPTLPCSPTLCHPSQGLEQVGWGEQPQLQPRGTCHKRRWCTAQPTGETEQEIAQRQWQMSRNTSRPGSYHLAVGRGCLKQRQQVVKPYVNFFHCAIMMCNSSLCLSSPSSQKIWLFKYIIKSETCWCVCATFDASSGGEDERYQTQHSSDCQGPPRAHLWRRTRKGEWIQLSLKKHHLKPFSFLVWMQPSSSNIPESVAL